MSDIFGVGSIIGGAIGAGASAHNTAQTNALNEKLTKEPCGEILLYLVNHML